MSKTVLITGSTDGIGLLAAQKLNKAGHTVLLHGRSAGKLARVQKYLGGDVHGFVADLSSLKETRRLASDVLAEHPRIDVLINNAGALKASQKLAFNGMDIRFVVNTLAPYVLTHGLLKAIPTDGRILNLSSAAQAPVDTNALSTGKPLDATAAYSQSKLAVTIWSMELAKTLPDGPVVIAVNPGSLPATKMVKEGFGMAGNNVNIGADILVSLSLDPRFANDTGRYFDNDASRFEQPHPAANNKDH